MNNRIYNDFAKEGNYVQEKIMVQILKLCETAEGQVVPVAKLKKAFRLKDTIPKLKTDRAWDQKEVATDYLNNKIEENIEAYARWLQNQISDQEEEAQEEQEEQEEEKKRYETYIRTNGVYKFLGHYEIEESNGPFTVNYWKQNKQSWFYKVHNINTGETEFYKYLKKEEEVK